MPPVPVRIHDNGEVSLFFRKDPVRIGDSWTIGPEGSLLTPRIYPALGEIWFPGGLIGTPGPALFGEEFSRFRGSSSFEEIKEVLRDYGTNLDPWAWGKPNGAADPIVDFHEIPVWRDPFLFYDLSGIAWKILVEEVPEPSAFWETRRINTLVLPKEKVGRTLTGQLTDASLLWEPVLTKYSTGPQGPYGNCFYNSGPFSLEEEFFSRCQ